VLKYATQFTALKLKGTQMKLFGCLVISQSLMMHQKMRYGYALLEAKNLIDAFMVAVLFLMGFFHLTRLNYLVPNTYRGEYQLMAQKVVDRNEDLNLKSDSVYENQIVPSNHEFEDEE
jgi:hypothetical protein